MKRIAGYIRVSTTDQHTEIQAQQIEKFAAYKCDEFELQYFKDKRTGTNTRRPGFQAMLKAAREKKIDMIIVYKLDRAFRNALDGLKILQELQKLGVAFVSITESLDFSTPQGKMFIQLLAVFAEFEAGLIKERVTAGVNAAIDERKKLGKCWGPKPTVDQEAVKDRYGELGSMRKTAKEFGVSVRTDQRAVKKEF